MYLLCLCLWEKLNFVSVRGVVLVVKKKVLHLLNGWWSMLFFLQLYCYICRLVACLKYIFFSNPAGHSILFSLLGVLPLLFVINSAFLLSWHTSWLYIGLQRITKLLLDATDFSASVMLQCSLFHSDKRESANLWKKCGRAKCSALVSSIGKYVYFTRSNIISYRCGLKVI